MYKAVNVASWFVNNGYRAENSKDGNLKLNKLLYLAQMISLAKYNKPLFLEDLYAFENGVVVEDIRKSYCNNYNDFVKTLIEDDYRFDDTAEDILNITKDIYMDVSPKELSEMTHTHLCWKDSFERSKRLAYSGQRYNTSAARIDINEFENKYKSDIDIFRDMLEYVSREDYEEKFIKVEGIKFYYGDDVEITPELMSMLRDFPSDEKAYTMYMDPSQGLVIY